MEEQKDAANVRFFPPAVPLLTIFIGAGLEWLWPISSVYTPPSPARYYIGGTIVVGAFLLFGLWSVLLFRRGGQSENPWKPTPHIEERGPFRLTRNPMYLQMILICIGFSVAFANWWVLLLTPLAVWALQTLAIKPEEAYLEAKFGETYLAYRRKVRRWI